jgi:hypothetical protein
LDGEIQYGQVSSGFELQRKKAVALWATAFFFVFRLLEKSASVAQALNVQEECASSFRSLWPCQVEARRGALRWAGENDAFLNSLIVLSST